MGQMLPKSGSGDSGHRLGISDFWIASHVIRGYVIMSVEHVRNRASNPGSWQLAFNLSVKTTTLLKQRALPCHPVGSSMPQTPHSTFSYWRETAHSFQAQVSRFAVVPTRILKCLTPHMFSWLKGSPAQLTRTFLCRSRTPFAASTVPTKIGSC